MKLKIMHVLTLISIFILSGCSSSGGGYSTSSSYDNDNFRKAKVAAKKIDDMPAYDPRSIADWLTSAANFYQNFKISSRGDDTIDKVLRLGKDVRYMTRSTKLLTCYGAGGKPSTFSYFTSWTGPKKYYGTVYEGEAVFIKGEKDCGNTRDVNPNGEYIVVAAANGSKWLIGYVPKSALTRQIPSSITVASKSQRESGRGGSSIGGLGLLGLGWLGGMASTSNQGYSSNKQSTSEVYAVDVEKTKYLSGANTPKYKVHCSNGVYWRIFRDKNGVWSTHDTGSLGAIHRVASKSYSGDVKTAANAACRGYY